LGSIPLAYRFTGQRWEQGLGLYYYKARWYDPLLGRFVQPDTLVPKPGEPQDLNRYTYVRNNPLKYTDPGGHLCVFGVGLFGSCAEQEDMGRKVSALLVVPIARVWWNATVAVKTTETVL